MGFSLPGGAVLPIPISLLFGLGLWGAKGDCHQGERGTQSSRGFGFGPFSCFKQNGFKQNSFMSILKKNVWAFTHFFVSTEGSVVNRSKDEFLLDSLSSLLFSVFKVFLTSGIPKTAPGLSLAGTELKFNSLSTGGTQDICSL